ncbi:hypothetical protein J437_LFUL017196 [Ladona fulva]|uniref:Single domain-containing protein n=1 Tax=Ladona fulva TaxID=123851 RepID=A0A8K0KN89_LADFU|nr:hypothetical protein J437_LFUL017196 [Ladona fulva]
MKVFCLCVLAVLACLLASTEAATSLQPAEVDPKRPNGCLWTDPKTKQKTYHASGSSWKIGPCARASCNKQNGKLVLLMESCGVIGVRPNCKLSAVDSSKNYPQCCPKEICT